MTDYPSTYDAVFWEVRGRIQEHGYARKLDLAALACWKRSAQGAWVSDLLAMPESKVREATASASRSQPMPIPSMTRRDSMR